MPKVSVIVPNYNHARFLEQRVQSILDQTFQDFEIIYLDDASTDDSNQVFSQYSADPRVKSLLNRENSGSPFKQWYKGFAVASGEYIWIAESDDYAASDFLDTLVYQLDCHQSVGIAYCQSWKIDGQGEVHNIYEHSINYLAPQKWLSNYIESGNVECKKYLSISNTIPNASAVLIRKACIPQNKDDITKMRLAGDWLFWVEILLKADIAYVAAPLNYFRSHDNTVRSHLGSRQLALEHLQIFSRLASQIEIPHPTFTMVRQKIIGCYFKSYNPLSPSFKEVLGLYIQLALLSIRYRQLFAFTLHFLSFSVIPPRLRVKLKESIKGI